MLNLSRNNNNSTQVEDIVTNRFGDMHKNISKIYDFFDKEYLKNGNMEELDEILKSEFFGFEIYTNGYIQISISSIVVQDGQLMTSLKVTTPHTDAVYFGHDYLKGCFEERETGLSDHFKYIHTKLNVVDIEREINKRFVIINNWVVFKAGGYKFLYLGVKNKRIYKKLKVRKGTNPLSLSHLEYIEEKRLNTYFLGLKNNLSDLGTIEDKSNRAFEVDIKGKKIEICKYGVESTRDLYIGVENLTFTEAEDIYAKISHYIENISIYLKEKRKVAKEINSIQRKLYIIFLGDNTSEQVIFKKLKYFHRKYIGLESKGERAFSPKVVDLLGDMIRVFDESEGRHSPVIDSSNVYYKDLISPKSYIIQNYNIILESIAIESEHTAINYYKYRLKLFFAEGNLDLEEFQSLISKISKFSSKNWLESHIFDEIVPEMTSEHIHIVIETMGSDHLSVIFDLYKEVLKHDYSYDIESDLKIYKDIFDANINTKNLFIIEDIVVFAITCGLISKPENIQKIDTFIGNHMLLELIYKASIDSFELKYSSDIIKTFYYDLIGKDKKNIGKKEIDFHLYSNINNSNIEIFMDYVVVPYMVYRLHTENNIESLEKLDETARGSLLEILSQINVDVKLHTLIRELINYRIYELMEKKCCSNILGYCNVVKGISVIDDYTLSGLEGLEGILYDSKYKTDSDLITQLMVNDRLALKFLDKHTMFSSEIGKILAKHSSIEVRKRIAANINLELEEAIVLFCGETEQEEEVVLAFLDKHTMFSSKIGKALAIHSSIEVRKRIAANINLELEEAIALFCGEEEQEEEVVLEFLKKYNSFARKIGIALAKHSSIEVKKTLVRCEYLDNEMAKILFCGEKEQEEEVVIEFLESNSPFSVEIRKALAKHSSEEVRRRL